MPDIEPGDFLRGVVEMVYDDGSIAQNVFTWRAAFDAAQDFSVVLPLIAEYIEDMYDLIGPELKSTILWNPFILYRMVWNALLSQWEVGDVVGEYIITPTTTGTADAFPNQIAPVITAGTDRPKSRGRKFIPGCVETIADGSDLIASAITDFTNFAVEYADKILIATGNNMVPGVLRTGVQEFLPFTFALVNSVVGTQRRRKPGVGV